MIVEKGFPRRNRMVGAVGRIRVAGYGSSKKRWPILRRSSLLP
jgi:hypothetical protein